MKKYVLLLIIAFSVSSETMAQKEEKEGKKVTPPQAAKIFFVKTFPGSTNVRWVKEGADYEAEFKQMGKSMSAVFSADGTMLETETTILISELPAPVLQYLKEHYKRATIKEAAKVVKSDGAINYEAEVYKVDVIFDVNGKFIREAKD